MIYVGIDNGLKGGITIINEKEEIIICTPMPIKNNQYNITAIQALLEKIIEEQEIILVGLEKSHTMPINGAKANFTNGYNYGIIITLLELLNLPYKIILASHWQKALLDKEKHANTKIASIKYCQNKYPEYDFTPTPRSKKPSDGLTDSLCIAIYTKRTDNKDEILIRERNYNPKRTNLCDW